MIAPPNNNHDCILLCLGDSITYGFPYGYAYSWVAALEGKIPAKPLNRGINGDTTEDMLRRLRHELSKGPVTHAHILGGTNDAWLETEPSDSRQWVEQMVLLCIERNIKPILGITTPICAEPAGQNSFIPFGLEAINGWLARHRKWLAEYAAAQTIPLIDYFTPLCVSGTPNGDPRFFLDEAHLNHEGNRIMAVTAEQALLRLL